MAILKKDLFTTSGDEVLREVIKRQYDVDIDLNDVSIEIEELYNSDRRKAVVKAIPGGKYHGRSWFNYIPVPLTAYQLNERFVIEAELPLRVVDVIDEMYLRYGILIETHDLGESEDVVLTETRGQLDLLVYGRSKRFSGVWQFEIASPNSSLSQLITPTSAANLLDVLVE